MKTHTFRDCDASARAVRDVDSTIWLCCMNRSLPPYPRYYGNELKTMSDPKPNNSTYRIRNWPEYNAALIQRGSFTLWLDEAMLEQWYNTEKSGRRGASNLYSDLAIQCALTLKAVYRLPLRATQGFLGSLLELMQIPLRDPHYSTCCRRQARLEVRIPCTVSAKLK